jgi:prophage antirepressor-like protein
MDEKMTKENTVVLFNQKQVRLFWDDDEELWYFSIVDVIEILTDSKRPRRYWNDLKKKLYKEGSELSEKIGQLKMLSSDGKKYLSLINGFFYRLVIPLHSLFQFYSTNLIFRYA